MRWLALTFAILLVVAGITAVDIYTFSLEDDVQLADVAIVLGAGTMGNQPPPVFAERINHAIELYKAGIVKKLLMTGGRGANGHSEGWVAQNYAVARGVKPEDILIEEVSRTTYENLVEAQKLMKHYDFANALIVSDPLHMRRSMVMASGLGIDAHSSPTPTTLYRSWQTQLPFLWRETYQLMGHRLADLFGIAAQMNNWLAPNDRIRGTR